MTRRNNKRNNRHNSQRNNKTEFSPFASMLFGALLGKGTEMIAEKMAEKAKRLLIFTQKELPTRTSTTSTTVMQPYLSCIFLLMVRQLSTLSLITSSSSSLRMVG